MIPQKGYKPGVYRLVSGTVTGGVWSPDQGSGVPHEGFNPGVLKTVTVALDIDHSTSPDSEDPGIYRTVNGFVTSNIYSNAESPQEGFIPGVFRSAPDGSPVPGEGFIPGQAGIILGSISGGIWRGSPSISSATTTDLAGAAQPASITFNLSGCLYVTGSNGNSLGSLFTFYLDSGSGPVEILKTLATFLPTSPWEPIPQSWQVTFGSTTIGDARGDSDQFWKDGDILTMELKASFASLLQIRPDCVFANIDEANDIGASPIGITPVNNLYKAPVALSVVISSSGTAKATFNEIVADDGGSNPYTGDAVLYDCDTLTSLPITAVSTSGKTLDYTFTGVVNPGDNIEWSAAGISVNCSLIILDDFTGTPGNTILGRTPDVVGTATWINAGSGATDFNIGADGDSIIPTSAFTANLIDSAKDSATLEVGMRFNADAFPIGAMFRSMSVPGGGFDALYLLIGPNGLLQVFNWSVSLQFSSGIGVFPSTDFTNGFVLVMRDNGTSIDFFDKLYPSEGASWTGLSPVPGQQFVGVYNDTIPGTRVITSFGVK